jgi:hypothetical protein
MGFAVWLDREGGMAWAQGTQEYRPMGAAVIAITGQFRHRDFHSRRARPRHLEDAFAGFFGSLEEVNEFLRSRERAKKKNIAEKRRRITPHIAR